MRKKVLEFIENYMDHNEKTFFLTADLGYGAIENIEKKFKRRFINTGISEANTILVATGLALEGNLVFVYSIGNFISLRIVEYLRNGPLYHNLKIIIIALGAGFSYGQLGFTHHLTEDISVMRALPMIDIYSPADPYEAEYAIKSAIKSNNTSYIRLSKNTKIIHDLHSGDYLNDITEISKGEDLQIITTGEIISEAIISQERLHSLGFSIGIISVNKLKPLNKKILRKYIHSKLIITLEEHNLDGGFGSLILEEISNWENQPKVIRIGLENKFSNIVGDNNYLLKVNDISSEIIVEKCLKILTKES
jgi:transketolase